MGPHELVIRISKERAMKASNQLTSDPLMSFCEDENQSKEV